MAQRDTRRVTVSEINAMNEMAFISLLGGVYEHSEWIAKQIFEHAHASTGAKGHHQNKTLAFRDVDHIVHVFMDAVEQYVRPHENRSLNLVCEHPELAVADPSQLSLDSQREQRGAGLSLESLSTEQQKRFREYNTLYKQRFAMPFVTCVRNQPNKALGILQAFESRIHNDLTTEMHRALDEIKAIAEYRLRDRLVNDNDNDDPLPDDAKTRCKAKL